jgi:UDP-N-acetylmuramoyl-L-alanyl-D-glutamate--2,6-diaminopimelate ligase
MKLSALVGDDAQLPPGSTDVDITGLSLDSRAIEPGMLFAALPGARADGARFVSQAIAQGAVAVLASPAAEIPAGVVVPVARAADPRLALARIAARFYPRQPRHIVAVTGTSGKTSVAEFTRQILAACGHRSASLGTIGVITSDGARYGSLTTPDTITLHQTLDTLAGDGITHLAMEASSHGLDQCRLDGVRLTAGAFTNMGRDHLDYHPNEAAYFDAKLRLFRELLKPGQAAVFDADGHAMGDALARAKAFGLKTIAVGKTTPVLEMADERLWLTAVKRIGFRQFATIQHGSNEYDLEVPLIGAYQLSNALVAAALAKCCGLAMGDALNAIEKLTVVNGRLDVVGERKGALVVVDYAHKPDALAAALDALRPFATGRLICVFGCGGDRDKGKRAIMGKIAVEKANVVIVTDDNPRSEDPARIRAEILAAAPGAIEIGDRAEAVGHAIGLARAGDVVLIAGKGHEPGQIVGSVTQPFSDHDVARAAIARA